MITTIQAVAGANQFTGGAGAGLLTFTDLNLPTDDMTWVPCVTILSLETAAAASITTLDCYLLFPGDALSSLRRSTIRRWTTATAGGFSMGGCEIFVPRDNTTGNPWQLIVVTTGKAADADLVVSYDKARWPPQ